MKSLSKVSTKLKDFYRWSNPLSSCKLDLSISHSDLRDINKALVSLSSHNRRNFSWCLLCIYFGITGFIFDILNPEVGFITTIFRFTGEITTMYPSNWFELGKFFIAWNGIAMIVSVAMILIIKKPAISGPLAGIAIALVGYFHYASQLIGIITVTWHAIFGAIVFVIILINSISDEIWIELIPFSDEVMSKRPRSLSTKMRDRLEDTRDGLWNVIRLLIQGFLSFTAITGVTMTILFRQGFSDIEAKMTAIQMTSGFLFSVVALYIWIGVPMLNMLSVTRAINRYKRKGYI